MALHLQNGEAAMRARLAYLPTPAPGIFLLNFQSMESDAVLSVEISKAHLANILIDGTALALREQYPHRVPAAAQGMQGAG